MPRSYVRPLVAAWAGKHFLTADSDLSHHNGADPDPDVRGQSGRNTLHAAAFSGNFEILIEYNPAYVNARDGRGWTPLLMALGGRNFKDGSALRLLLEHGPDINGRTENGWTPLHWASFKGTLEVVRLLLDGADVEVKKDSKTALQVAADGGLEEVVELLREHGAK